MKCKRAKTHVIKTHEENQDFSLSHLSESEVDTTKFVPWCRITRDSPSSLAVVRKGVAAETVRARQCHILYAANSVCLPQECSALIADPAPLCRT